MAGPVVSGGSMCLCTFGVAPGILNPLPVPPVFFITPVGNILDTIPMVELTPFGACISPANPTCWKGPVFSPGVCIPAPIWVPMNPTIIGGGAPILDLSSTAICSTFSGVIKPINTPAMTIVAA